MTLTNLYLPNGILTFLYQISHKIYISSRIYNDNGILGDTFSSKTLNTLEWMTFF